MHNHGLFAGNVFAHWVASMSSIVSFSLGIVEYLRNRRLETWIFTVIACLFLIVAFDQAWQDEHHNSQVLIGEKAAVSGERDFWRKQSYDKDSTIRSLTKTLFATTVPEAKQYVQLQQQLPEKAFQIIITTNKSHPSPDLVMQCNANFDRYSFQIVRGEGEVQISGPSVMQTKRSAEIIIFSPAWDQMHPLVVNIFGASPQLKKCTLRPL